MFATLRVSNAQNKWGLFSEGGMKETFLQGLLERADGHFAREGMELLI